MKAKGWKESDFHKAAFYSGPDGVRFTAQVVEHGGGRRVVDHEVVDGAGWGEDTGRQLRSFTVRAVVSGKGYLKASELLDRLLDAPGPGCLVHPLLGRLSVNVTSWKARFGGRLGIVEYDIECRESGKPLSMAPVEAASAKSWASKFADDCADFADEVMGPVQQTLDSVSEAINEVATAVNAVSDTMRKLMDPGLVGKVLQSGKNLVASVGGLIKTPGEIARAWSGMIDTLVEDVKRLGPGHGGDVSDACVAACNAVQPPPAAPTTPTEVNAFVLRQVARSALASGACQGLVEAVSTGNGPTTFDDLTAKAAVVTALLGQVAGEANYPAPWRSAMDLRDATGRILGDAALTLPHLRTWMPPRTMSVLEVCQRLYGSATRADEVIDRNGVACPLWVTDPLRVIEEAA